jgi:hypothetical protein
MVIRHIFSNTIIRNRENKRVFGDDAMLRPIYLLAIIPLWAQAPIPQAVSALQGTYTGSWISYRLNPDGQPAKAMSWTDTMTAGNPTGQSDRAFVTTTDEMVFNGGRPEPMKVGGSEGYLLNRDGSLGDYFIKTAGQEFRMRQLGDSVWAYTAKASEAEAGQLGIPKGGSAVHVLVKVITKEGGEETHRITRLTTATWKEADGKDRSAQFVSLAGAHKRRP